MSSGKLGMQVDEVRLLARTLKTDSDALTRIISDVTNQLERTFWKGPDHDRFRNDWMGQHRSDLKAVAAALDAFGGQAQKNADAQETASN